MERFHITLSPDFESTTEYRKRNIDTHIGGHILLIQEFPIETKPEYVTVTTRGIGGSQFLDTLTQHGGGTIGNQNGFGAQKDILNF